MHLTSWLQFMIGQVLSLFLSLFLAFALFLSRLLCHSSFFSFLFDSTSPLCCLNNAFHQRIVKLAVSKLNDQYFQVL